MTWITTSIIAGPLAAILLLMELGRQAGLWIRDRRGHFRENRTLQ
jgi:hypothetical protein